MEQHNFVFLNPVDILIYQLDESDLKKIVQLILID